MDGGWGLFKGGSHIQHNCVDFIINILHIYITISLKNITGGGELVSF